MIKSPRRRDALLRAACVAPPLLLLAALIVYPLVQTAYLSLTRSTFISPQPRFVWFDNYVQVLKDPALWTVC